MRQACVGRFAALGGVFDGHGMSPRNAWDIQRTDVPVYGRRSNSWGQNPPRIGDQALRVDGWCLSSGTWFGWLWRGYLRRVESLPGAWRGRFQPTRRD